MSVLNIGLFFILIITLQIIIENIIEATCTANLENWGGAGIKRIAPNYSK